MNLLFVSCTTDQAGSGQKTVALASQGVLLSAVARSSASRSCLSLVAWVTMGGLLGGHSVMVEA